MLPLFADPFEAAISTEKELGAYEALWSKPKTSFGRLACEFRSGKVPSEVLGDDKEALQFYDSAHRIASGSKFDICVVGEYSFPKRLIASKHMPGLLYFRGSLSLALLPSVAVVGTRKPSESGVKRTRQLVRGLVEQGWAIVSGLATGIDTAAHSESLACGGRTIGVIGTPIHEVYPAQNRALQERLAAEHLLLSQVPICRYADQDYRMNRLFFPERNMTMAALSSATVIVEAGETSGSLIQAREALRQKRQVFILNSCFEKGLLWPDRLEKKGAIRVRSFDDIFSRLSFPSDASSGN